MPRPKLLLLGVVAALLAGCSASPAPAVHASGPIQAMPLSSVRKSAPSADQAKAIATFGEQLFAQVRKGGDPNAVISPLSVFYALGMAGDGAGGDTAAAFEKVFGLTAEQARQVAAYLLADLAEPGPGTTLSAADSVWLDDTLTVKQDWVDRVAAYYQAEAVRSDLQAPATVGLVNDWIKGKTNGLIPEMLSEPLSPDTVALLVNALYLKAVWAQEFETSQTREGPFRPESGSEVKASYLNAHVERARCLDTGSATGVVLPYSDGRLGFLAAMPKSGQLALDGHAISGWLASAKDCSVLLSMPKFDAQYGSDLVRPLAALGLGSAFSDSADFSAMTPEPVFISKVLHKVTMSVGETGTEAAAATVVGIERMSLPAAPELAFDRPYVYAVVDLTTGVPLFLGAMDDPSKAVPAAR